MRDILPAHFGIGADPLSPAAFRATRRDDQSLGSVGGAGAGALLGALAVLLSSTAFSRAGVLPARAGSRGRRFRRQPASQSRSIAPRNSALKRATSMPSTVPIGGRPHLAGSSKIVAPRA